MKSRTDFLLMLAKLFWARYLIAVSTPFSACLFPSSMTITRETYIERLDLIKIVILTNIEIL